MQEAGYNSVGLDDVNAFLWRGTPLPAKPVLLTFAEAYREALDIADSTLASANMRAVVFVNVKALDAGSISLVSRHRLRQLVDTGRWEVGLAGCPRSPEEENGSLPTIGSTDQYRRGREQLEEWLERPVIAIDCQRSWPSIAETTQEWTQVVKEASFPLGFIHARPYANYRNDPPRQLRRLHVSRLWRGPDLITHLEANMPRRAAFVDDFKGPDLSAAWHVNHGEATVDEGSLRLSAKEGETGAQLALRGTERWKDASTEVQIVGRPEGQFWIELRGENPSAFMRLGVVDDHVTLQKSERDGETRQVVARKMKPGNLALRLRLIGSRAVAEVNGQTLLERPVEVPAGLDKGPLTLSVWDPAGHASAQIREVKAEPLRRLCGLIAAAPSPSAWDALRRQANDLSALSPRYFSWQAARGRELGKLDAAILIFAHFHHLRLLPALVVNGRISASDSGQLVEQALRWAQEPEFDGLNLVIDGTAATAEEWKATMAQLRERMAALGKELAVTRIVPSEGASPSVDLGEDVFAASSHDPSALDVAVAPLNLVRTGT